MYSNNARKAPMPELFNSNKERNEFFDACKDANLSFSMMVMDILSADEPIMCSDPECREVHTDWMFSEGTMTNGQELNLRALWDESKGRYVIMREEKDEGTKASTL